MSCAVLLPCEAPTGVAVVTGQAPTDRDTDLRVRRETDP